MYGQKKLRSRKIEWKYLAVAGKGYCYVMDVFLVNLCIEKSDFKICSYLYRIVCDSYLCRGIGNVG